MTVSGPPPVANHFEGFRGSFRAHALSRIGVQALESSLRGPNDAGEWSTLSIVVHGRPHLSPGTYEVRHFDVRDPEDGGVLIGYNAGTHEAGWTSTRGTIWVSEGSDERFAGRFDVVAHNCWASRLYCGDLPEVRIRGSFDLPARGDPD